MRLSTKEFLALTGAKPRHKYRAKPFWGCPECSNPTKKHELCRHGNHSYAAVYYHSKGEAHYWLYLKHLEKMGEITNLVREVPIHIRINGTVVGRYTCDYVFQEIKTKHTRYLDFKGRDTRDSKFRRKVLKAAHDIEVEIVKDVPKFR